MKIILKKKKNPPTYRPIGEMEGWVRETNIFLRVALMDFDISPLLIVKFSNFDYLELRNIVIH